jgi:ectoine hydroxylase-related dioxygenase (phytanoyl-CoA dioxygenase family)
MTTLIDIPPFEESSNLIGNGPAMRARWEKNGYVFFRKLLDPTLLAWGHAQYRAALAAEGLIDPANTQAPVWTGAQPKTRRPCDALGTAVSREIIKQPALNAVLREVFDDEVVWQPIVAHRSGLPEGPIADDHDIFQYRHQDGPFNEGMRFAGCWIPMRDVDLESGSFAIAPGTHLRGSLHSEAENFRIPRDAIPDEQWRAESYLAGDVLIFHHMTAHTALPNLSNEIRTSIDIRAMPSKAPQPIRGSVEKVEGTDVTILTDDGRHVSVHVDDNTYIRDMNPRPRIPTSELQRIAYPGAHVIVMVNDEGRTTVLRRNFY